MGAGEVSGVEWELGLTTSVRSLVKTPDPRERRGVKQGQGILKELTEV